MQRSSIVCILALLAVLPVLSYGQHELRIPPYTVNTRFLGDQIMGDTLSNGARRDSQAVYVLQRGGLYLSNTIIANSGWTITIKANDSTTTRRPIIQLYPQATGSSAGLPPGYFIQARGNVSVKNLIISGYWESAPVDTFIRGLQGALIGLSVQGYSVLIDSCILTNTNGNHVRTDPGGAHILSVTNCIFANMGYLGRSNLGAGKAIDLRAGSIDTCIVLNNTFVNSQDRIIRHFQSTAAINYLRFEHNTVVNSMSYHGMLSLGKVGPKAIIRDNLFVDAFALGKDTDAVRQAEFTDSGEKDAYNFPRMTWVISNYDSSHISTWFVSNNFYNVSSAGQAFWDSAAILPIVANPPLTVGSPLTYNINSHLGADSVTAFRSASVTLGNTPRLMVDMMKWYRRPASLGGAGKTKTTSNWSSPYDFDRKKYVYLRDTLDCTYPTSNSLYTAGRGGYPVGDLNWFPTRKAAWLADPISGVIKSGAYVPSVFTLEQNYPNPFNPSTNISFVLDKAGYTTLAVYNILGQKVATLLSQQMTAGLHEVSFNALHLSSGVYFYRLESGNNLAMKKMMLLK